MTQRTPIKQQGKAYTPEQREVILESLRPYLEMGFSRSKACKFIGLNETTLSKWVQADNALSIKLEGWENVLNTLAISNIADAIRKEAELNDDLRKDNTKWWLERKMKTDFSTRQEQTGADGKDLPSPIIKLNRDGISGDNSTE
jgi:transposase-like protein